MTLNDTSVRGTGLLRTALLVLAAATLAVYAVTLFNGFVLDDEVIIVKNPQTLSLKSIPEVLFAPDVIKPYYRPLNRATYLFDYQLAGMNPLWYHAVNILIHLGNALLFYLVCCRLLADRTAALAAALLFALHPANAEAVNFISARNTLMAAFFSLASLLAYMQAREKGLRWPLLSALLFFCGLLSKETAFMLIAVVALAVAVPIMPKADSSREPWLSRLCNLLPFLLATAIYLAMRVYSLQGVLPLQQADMGLIPRLAQNLTIIPQYLGLLLVPTDLTVFHSAKPGNGLMAFPGAVPAAWLAILTALWFLVRSGNRAALFGLAWCIINYAPISNIVPIPSDSITERFLYLPGIGFFIVLGALLSWINARQEWRKPLWAGIALIIIAFGTLTVQRNLDWKDDLTLFASGVKNNPASAEARFNLGTALRDVGNLQAAKHEWEQALSVDPTHAESLTQLGTLAAVQGDLQKAEWYYRAALRSPQVRPGPGKSMALYNLGKIYEKRQQPQQALQYYDQFLRQVTSDYEEFKTDAEQRVKRLRSTSTAGG